MNASLFKTQVFSQIWVKLTIFSWINSAFHSMERRKSVESWCYKMIIFSIQQNWVLIWLKEDYSRHLRSPKLQISLRYLEVQERITNSIKILKWFNLKKNHYRFHQSIILADNLRTSKQTKPSIIKSYSFKILLMIKMSKVIERLFRSRLKSLTLRKSFSPRESMIIKLLKSTILVSCKQWKKKIQRSIRIN